jgi:hypothetical protein
MYLPPAPHVEHVISSRAMEKGPWQIGHASRGTPLL